ncbi:MAG: mannonate dehydratase [Terriglobia bacterium]
MQTNRRTFVRLALGATAGGLLSYGFHRAPVLNGIKLGTFFSPNPTAEDFTFLASAGVEYVSIWTGIKDNNLDFMLETKRRFEAHNIQVYNIGILDLHCDPTLVLGLPGFDEKVEQYKAYLNNLGQAGIHYTTYAHISNLKNSRIPGPYQTAIVNARGGSTTRQFDYEVAKSIPLTFGKVYEADQIWATFTKFMQSVMPVAEKAGVRIGLHPDDPPVESLGGVARIFRNFEGYQRAIEIANSDNFGLCFCVGTWAEGGKTMGKDVIEMIQYFGARKRIFKVHFRNVSSPLPKFEETFVDNGYLDMFQVMRALRGVKYDGVVIPDHVPGGSYPQINNSFTLGYMKALRDRVNDEAVSS